MQRRANSCLAHYSPQLEQRFWAKVLLGDECWEWAGKRFPNGYGSFTVKGMTVMAHRAAYELIRGLIPEGLTIDHLCRNRACVRPDHLEAVTFLENVRRATPWNTLKESCPRGHPYDRIDFWTLRDGTKKYGRRCHTCRREQERERQRRNRAGDVDHSRR